MRFSSIVSALMAPLLVLAASNPFNNPTGGYNVVAGQTTQLSWKPTTSGTVSLVLRSGASSALSEGVTIASHIANSGSYSWQVSPSTPFGSQYTVEIIDDSNPQDYNFTPYFVIQSTVISATLASTVTLGAPTNTRTLPMSTDQASSVATGSAVTVSVSTTLSNSGAPTMSGSGTTATTMMTGSMMVSQTGSALPVMTSNPAMLANSASWGLAAAAAGLGAVVAAI